MIQTLTEKQSLVIGFFTTLSFLVFGAGSFLHALNQGAWNQVGIWTLFVVAVSYLNGMFAQTLDLRRQEAKGHKQPKTTNGAS